MLTLLNPLKLMVLLSLEVRTRLLIERATVLAWFWRGVALRVLAPRAMVSESSATEVSIEPPPVTVNVPP